MKRPLAVTGIVFTAAAAAAVFLGQKLVWPVGAVLLLCFAVSVKSKKLRGTACVPLVFIVSFAAFFSVGIRSGGEPYPLEKLEGQNVIITAEINDLPYQSYDRYYYSLSVSELKTRDGAILNGADMLLSSKQALAAAPSDIIYAEVRINGLKNNREFGGSDTLRAYMPYPETAQISAQETKPLYYYFLKLRYQTLCSIDELLKGTEAAFVKAFLTGERHYLDPGVRSELYDAGLSHILAVSGLHVSILMSLFIGAASLLLVRRRAIALSGALLLLVIMGVTGFPYPVVRASVMYLVFLLGVSASKRSDPLTSLSIAMLVILLPDPRAVSDPGLLMSFCSALGIILIQKPMSDMICERLFKTADHDLAREYSPIRYAGIIMTEVVCTAFSAELFMLPVLMICFGNASLYTALSSLLTFLTLPLLMAFSVLMLLFNMTSATVFLARIFAFSARLAAGQVMTTARVISGLPLNLISLTYGFVPIWIALSAALAVLLYNFRNIKHRVRIFAFTVTLAFLCGVVLSYFSERDITRICICDVGDGITAVLVRNGEAAVLSCGGDTQYGSRAAEVFENYHADVIDYMLLLKNDRRLSSYAENLISEHKTRVLGIYDPERFSDIEKLTAGVSERLELKAGRTESVTVNGFTVKSISERRLCAALADVHGYKLLVCADGTDCALLPEELRTPDMLIVNGSIENTAAISCPLVIISDEEEKSGWYGFENAGCVRSTCGNIIYRLSADNGIKETRETNWRS